jgi:tryptophan-rich sensory protein
MKKRKLKTRRKMFPKNPKILIYSVLAVIAASLIGTRFTDTSGWYESIKPAITPPNFVFGIVWTILFALIAIAMYFSISNSQGKARKKIITLFALNLIFNVLWSFLFFSRHQPALAFIDLILLWLSIVALIRISWKVSKLASWLLLPYAVWVTFAGLLNYLIAFY